MSGKFHFSLKQKTKMKDVMKNVLFNYLCYEDYFNVATLNKDTYRFFKESLKKKKIEEDISVLFPKRIIDMVGKEKFLKGKRIKWNDKYMGDTGYIDRTYNVKFDGNENIYYGRDCNERSFIFVNVRINNENKTETTVMSIFQRYIDSDYYYVAVEPKGKIPEFFLAQTSINNELYDKLQKVFSSFYEVKIKEGIFFESIEYTVQLY